MGYTLSSWSPKADDRRRRRRNSAAGIATIILWPFPSIVGWQFKGPVEGCSPSELRWGRWLIGFRPVEWIPAEFRAQSEGQIRVPSLHSSKLASERAEPEWIKQTPAANLTGVGNPFPGPRLRPFVEEHNLGTVDNVGLNTGNVYEFRHLGDPDHIVVRRPPNLNNMMVLVLRQAVRAEGVPGTIQTVHVAFALVRVAMDFAVVEEVGPQERLQPRWAKILAVTHSIDHWPNHDFLLISAYLLLVLDSQLVQLQRKSLKSMRDLI